MSPTISDGTASGSGIPITTPSGVQDLLGQSNYYIVYITSSRYGSVLAWLPDDVRISVVSSWGPIVSNVENALANYVGSNLGAFSGHAGGATFFSKKLTAQEWRGVEPLVLQLPLHFFAVKDANLEVIEPIKRLLKMSLPKPIEGSTDFFNLAPPGPVPDSPLTVKQVNAAIDTFNTAVDFLSLGDVVGTIPQVTSVGPRYPEDTINVYIGNFFTLKRVFISQISAVEFKAKLSVDGLPMEGLVEVWFKTMLAPTSDDIDTYMGGSMRPARTTG
jgi:hypothetical protein